MEEKYEFRYNELVNDIKSIIETSKNNAVRSVDFCRVQMYWGIGRRIFEDEQKGEDRAEYGSYLLTRLASEFEPEYGSGFSKRQLERARQFYKLYPNHAEFDDIFAYPLDFHNLPVLAPYFSNTETLTTIAEYYLRKNHFQDALNVYERLLADNPKEEILYQKAGYCRQMEGDWKGALKDYLRADLLNPQSTWVIRRIALCYRNLKQPEQALEYYHRYEALSPDNLSVQISIGHCYLELKEYNEALKYFYKVFELRF